MGDAVVMARSCATCRHAEGHSERPEHCAFCRGRKDRPGYEADEAITGDGEEE